MRSTLRIAACTTVALSALCLGAASASAEQLTEPATNSGAAVGVTVGVELSGLSLLGSLPALAGLYQEPEWS
ncbi:hypothetical protein [Streptomyces aurantiogriseus]|uniref:Secreted protein n=1 Tax=Streptomyces aurantiogriseus TaxID=66870 RepID=A0A918C567_9ACTN|nr:hypothetical protein [Streptomyces aurantiogriseus]GGR05358.1 hypothetical protein GCM10010251_21280 [Streptomyces aurantiogriseus]